MKKKKKKKNNNNMKKRKTKKKAKKTNKKKKKKKDGGNKVRMKQMPYVSNVRVCALKITTVKIEFDAKNVRRAQHCSCELLV
jgi:hypothetical protein